jgi:transcriptional regulator with XRE-family HTH domain
MRDKRDSNGLTIQEAAAKAGVSAATFSRVARGHLPDVEHLLLFAQWVGVAHVQLPVNEAETGESEQRGRDRERKMLVGYMCVSNGDGSQVLNLQRDAFLAAGVDLDHLCGDRASGKRIIAPA